MKDSDTATDADDSTWCGDLRIACVADLSADKSHDAFRPYRWRVMRATWRMTTNIGYWLSVIAVIAPVAVTPIILQRTAF